MPRAQSIQDTPEEVDVIKTLDEIARIEGTEGSFQKGRVMAVKFAKFLTKNLAHT